MDRFGDLRHALEEDTRAGRSGGARRPHPGASGAIGAQQRARRHAGDREKLLASVKRESEGLVRQIARARAAVHPRGEPQERVLTLASFLIRYGPGLLEEVEREVARWADPS